MNDYNWSTILEDPYIPIGSKQANKKTTRRRPDFTINGYAASIIPIAADQKSDPKESRYKNLYQPSWIKGDSICQGNMNTRFRKKSFNNALTSSRHENVLSTFRAEHRKLEREYRVLRRSFQGQGNQDYIELSTPTARRGHSPFGVVDFNSISISLDGNMFSDVESNNTSYFTSSSTATKELELLFNKSFDQYKDLRHEKGMSLHVAGTSLTKQSEIPKLSYDNHLENKDSRQVAVPCSKRDKSVSSCSDTDSSVDDVIDDDLKAMDNYTRIENPNEHMHKSADCNFKHITYSNHIFFHE